MKSSHRLLLVLAAALAALVLAILLRSDERAAPDSDAGRVATPPANAGADVALPTQGATTQAAPESNAVRTAAAAAAPRDQGAEAGPLTVRVESVQGLRVDQFPVRLRLRDRELGDAEHLWMRTGDDGCVRFDAAEVKVVQAQLAGSPLVAEIGTRTHPPVSVELPPGDVPTEPVVLVVDMCRVVVQAATPDGELWTRSHGLLVRPEAFHYYSLTGNPPLIGWVPRTCTYELKVYGCGLYADGEEQFSIPGADEFERSHVVKLGDPVSGIRGRVVDRAGVPVPRGDYVSLVDRGRDGGGGRLAGVRDDGAFEYALRLGEVRGRRHVFEVSHNAGERNAYHRAQAATASFLVAAPGEFVDLGTLVLEPIPLLVAGRVTLPDGLHLAGIRVEPQVLRNGEWTRHPDVNSALTTDEDGVFQTRARDLPGQMRLKIATTSRADIAEYRPAIPVEFEAGTEGLVIPLVATGGIQATVDLSGFGMQSRGTCLVDVRPTGAAGFFRAAASRITAAPDLPSGGMIQLTRLPPGQVLLRLAATRGDAPLQTWGPFEVRAGETTDLGALTTTENPRSIALSVKVPKGTAPVVFYGPAGERPLSFRATFHGDAARLVANGVAVDALVCADGCVPKRIENLSLDAEIELMPMAPLSLRLRNQEAFAARLLRVSPQAQLNLLIEPLQLDGASNGWLSSQEVARLTRGLAVPLSAKSTDSFELSLPAPGTYRLRAEASPKSGYLHSQLWKGYGPTSVVLGEFGWGGVSRRDAVVLDLSEAILLD